MARITIRPSKPHFCKPIMPGCLQAISIPHAFFMKYLLLGEKLEDKAILRTRKCGNKPWSVTIRESCFEDGWEDFVRAHDLRIGDFLVFKHVGGLVFHVLMFDHTESERVYPSLDDQKMKKANTIEKMNNKMNEKVAKEFHGSKGKSSAKRVEDPPQFTVTLQPRHLNWQTLTVDQNFARENGLTNRRRMITLRDPKGKLWKVRLNHKESSGKVYFQSGWPEFRDGHKLKAEDGCTFKLVSKGFKNIVIEAMVVVIQIFMAKELFNLLRKAHDDRQLPGFRLLNWHFFFTAVLLVCGLILSRQHCYFRSILIQACERTYQISNGHLLFLIHCSWQTLWVIFSGLRVLERTYLLVGWLYCDPDPMFKPESYSLPGWPFEITCPPIRDYDFEVADCCYISLERGICTTSAMACFVLGSIQDRSLPFGGFFASGFKRAFKVKDFGDSIPGHGGIMDRMDCQMVMLFFAYIYHQSFIKSQNYSVEMIFDQILRNLTSEEQHNLYIKLGQDIRYRQLYIVREPIWLSH
ncbi:hypothetical protein IFM89_012356 [Coptis chinensis]|uniref:Phosphatidate cytidylyltransferase n=1 Tax=Coptis chinensis TaxID=261450 RepID=A0A835I2Q9_9MAGN|nr:hypothetical protein IFM89_012356 [Coptis chinensis]